MTKQHNSKYFCPLYDRDIAEGECLDINYERLGYLSAGCLDEITRFTGRKESEIAKICEACSNLPFPDGLGNVIYPNKGS